MPNEYGQKTGGDDAVTGRGANPNGGGCAAIVKLMNVDEEEALKLLAAARGDYTKVLKNAGITWSNVK